MNPRVNEIGASLIREIAAKRRPTSCDLGLGEPSLRPNPAHLAAGMKYAAEHGLKYTANAGDLELREWIARHYNYPNLNAPENVCITTGSQEAMYVAIKTLLDPARDELLIVEPAFPSYAKMAMLEGVATRGVVMDEAADFAFDAQAILAAVGERTRAIVICSPNNPTARVIDRATVRAISDALLARAGQPIWVIHDEIYREQTFIDNAGYFAETYPHTIVTNSVSKSNALTGLRLGWVLAPTEIAPSIVKAHAWVTSCADTFGQQVALHIFRQPDGLIEHGSWYVQQRSQVIQALRKSKLRFITPEGSFYAAIALPSGLSSLQAAHELADLHDVIAIPGIAFGPAFEGWLRISWVAPIEIVREGITRIADFISGYRK
ncbi:MAG: pyridoxal phosphate-dependent aminotransferase [Candidatus Eremiobacteraeota bacterium]|nr:pyridoxal phosphate-dependent aminotransferase [Candidatus Eremiobacteraeota bacterium]